MKKIMTTSALAALLVTALHATPTAGIVNPYDAEFAKMNQLFDSLMQSHFNTAKLQNIVYPRVDIKDTPKLFQVSFDLAGVDKKDIKLTIDDNNILTLEGKKEQKVENKTDHYLKQEIFYGTFQRMIQLPENIDQNKLETKFKDGILTVSIPKVEVKKPKAKIIPIK